MLLSLLLAQVTVWGCGPASWIGDSIVAGTGSSPSTPPVQLASLSGRPIVNEGHGGDTTAQCATRWTAIKAAAVGKILIWSCGVNDANTGVTGATAYANASAVWADAKAAGWTVIVTGIMPWKNSAGWTQAKNDQGVIYNGLAVAWCLANGGYFVATTSMGGQGGDADVLQTIYDSGDDIHPNATGAGVLAALANGARP